MKVYTLLENDSCDEDLIHKHGLSLYIETADKKILFDMGPDDSFLKNAQKLKVDLSHVQFAVVSHGHYDHGGGLSDFVRINRRARIFMHRTALEGRFAKEPQEGYREIGLTYDRPLDERFILVDGHYRIDENMEIVLDFKRSGYAPDGNRSLFEKGPDGELRNDLFQHEIALLIQEGGKQVLITGCSHSGIGNIMNSVAHERGGLKPDYVIGGFHLFNTSTKRLEKKERIDALIDELARFDATVFFTGHCTTPAGYDYLKSNMKNDVREIHSGSIIEI